MNGGLLVVGYGIVYWQPKSQNDQDELIDRLLTALTNCGHPPCLPSSRPPSTAIVNE